MAKVKIEKLNYVKTASKEKAFSLTIKKDGKTQNVVYFANVEKNDDVMNRGKQNKGCFLSSMQVIRNLYDHKDILYHGLAARRHYYPYQQYADFQHTYKCITDKDYNPIKNDLINVVQTQNTFYGIDNLSTYGHYYVNDEFYKYLCRENQYYMPAANKIDTYIYSTDIDTFSLSSAVSCVLSDVQYNTIFEIPGNQYNDYNSGSMFATAVKAKNQYNATYDMKHDSTHPLKNARSYSQICNCNNQLYLKYKDNLQYKTDKLSTSCNGILFKHLKAPETSTTTTGCGNIPQIEVLTNINRGISTTNHKSTLYSIDISNMKIFDKSNTDIWPAEMVNKDNIIMNLKQEIKNVVRKIVEGIQPANTQLFAVTVTS